MTITLAGYALPWDAPAYVDGLTETCAPRAVAPDSGRNIELLFGLHDGQAMARTRDRSLELFADDYGLGFLARVDSARSGALAMARTVRSGETTFASVNFIHMSTQDRAGDRRIVSASIDHIAIVGEAAYADTGVWLRSAGHHPSARLRDLADCWENSYQNRMQASGRAPASAARTAALQAPAGGYDMHSRPANYSRAVPASVLQCLADNEAFLRRHRNRWPPQRTAGR